jgi:hypothetical protein
MKYEIYQWVVPIISLFFMIRVGFQFVKNKRSIFSTIVWSIFWVLIGLLAIIPNAISFRIADLLGFRDNVNAVIFVALGILFLLVFYLSSVIDKMETQLTELVRRIALEKPDTQQSNEPSLKKEGESSKT